MPPIEILSLCAAFCSTTAFAPQAIKAIRHKQTRDISLWSYLLFIAGILLWLGYGSMIGSLPLIVCNAVTLPLAAITLVLKLRHG